MASSMYQIWLQYLNILNMTPNDAKLIHKAYQSILREDAQYDSEQDAPELHAKEGEELERWLEDVQSFFHRNAMDSKAVEAVITVMKEQFEENPETLAFIDALEIAAHERSMNEQEETSTES